MTEIVDTNVVRMFATAGFTVHADMPSIEDPAALVRQMCDELDAARLRRCRTLRSPACSRSRWISSLRSRRSIRRT
jgi:hypothetical protein